MSELITINFAFEEIEDSSVPLGMKNTLSGVHFVIKPREIFVNGGQDFLFFSKEGLTYCSQKLGEMRFDFESMLAYHKRQNYRITDEPLYRALGLKKNATPMKKLWDITCGTGKDFILIASFGAHGALCGFERHPVVYLLLQDALHRMNQSTNDLNLNLQFGDPSLLEDQEVQRPDVIYYDPMYPEKKKSALPRKEMQIFKELVGSDQDSIALFEWAFKMAQERVVVKRPPDAPPIKEHPTASYKGKSVRYDMYKVGSCV